MPPKYPAKIDFYYDICSPGVYIALATLLRYKEEWNLDIELFPVHLWGLMSITDNANAGEVLPIKTSYLTRDTKRMIWRAELDIKLPGPDPSDPAVLEVGRFLRTLKDVEEPETLLECTLSLLEALHSKRVPISPVPAFLRTLLQPSRSPFAQSSKPPLDASRLTRYLDFSNTKQYINVYEREPTEMLSTWGGFSVPWIIAHRVVFDDTKEKPRKGVRVSQNGDFNWNDEMQGFWGVDRIESMAYFLGPEYVYRGYFPDGRPVREMMPAPPQMSPVKAAEWEKKQQEEEQKKTKAKL